jgi:tyrosyl-tRNA synthetase
LDKLLAQCRLADSSTDAQRKIKQGAVRIDGEVKKEPIVTLKSIPIEVLLNVGRHWKKVRIS